MVLQTRLFNTSIWRIQGSGSRDVFVSLWILDTEEMEHRGLKNAFMVKPFFFWGLVSTFLDEGWMCAGSTWMVDASNNRSGPRTSISFKWWKLYHFIVVYCKISRNFEYIENPEMIRATIMAQIAPGLTTEYSRNYICMNFFI